jgi:hypothetical protein
MLNPIESLLAELEAIRAFDAIYNEAREHQPIEEQAYNARQIRRSAIAEQLRVLGNLTS